MKKEIKRWLTRHPGVWYTNKGLASYLRYPEASIRRATRELYVADFSINRHFTEGNQIRYSVAA